MNYEDRKETRLERFKQLAKKNLSEANSSYEQSNRLAGVLPFGQPILVGHHSEKAHRNHIKKIHNAMDKSIKLRDTAEYYENKAKSLENNTSISSDDPEAVVKLKEKLNGLEEKREKIKEHNKKATKEGKEKHPTWMLSNLSQNIRSIKLRIEKLNELKNVEEIEETINGVKLKVDKEENRVRLFFPGKPDEEIRNKLKRNGFRWSPYAGAWQRMINDWSIHLAREIANGVAQ